MALNGADSSTRELTAAVLDLYAGSDLDGAGIELAHYPGVEALEEAVVVAGGAVPEVVLVPVAARACEGSLAQTVYELSARALALLQAWLASEALAEGRLVLLTRGAIALADSEAPNLAQAALPGLMRSASSARTRDASPSST